MAKLDQILDELKARGLRLTPQRILILSAIAEGGGHLGVDEIHRRASKSYPYMDIATVYRALNLFKQLGVVTEVGIGDRLHFELTNPDNRHQHMVCRQCGATFDLSPVYLEELRTTILKELHFEPDLSNFAITGVCANCSKSSAH